MAEMKSYAHEILDNNINSKKKEEMRYLLLKCYVASALVTAGGLSYCSRIVYSVYFPECSKYYSFGNALFAFTLWFAFQKSFHTYLIEAQNLYFETLPRFSSGLYNLGYSVLVPVITMPIVFIVPLILGDQKKLREELIHFTVGLFITYFSSFFMAIICFKIIEEIRAKIIIKKHNNYVEKLVEEMEKNPQETPLELDRIKSMDDDYSKVLKLKSCVVILRILQGILIPGALTLCIVIIFTSKDLSTKEFFNHGIIIIFIMLLNVEYIIISMIVYKNDHPQIELKPWFKRIGFTVFLREIIYTILIYLQVWTVLPLLLIEENISVFSLSMTSITQITIMLIMMSIIAHSYGWKKADKKNNRV